MSFDPLFALLVIAVLALPYLIWLIRADALAMPPWPAIADLGARALHWGWLLGGLVLAMSGIVLLVVLNSGWFARNAGGSADHLPAAGRSAGARLRLFLRHRAGARRKPDRRPVQSRSRRRRRGRRAADVGARRDRRDRRSRSICGASACCASVWAAAIVAPALGGDRDDAVPALDRQRRGGDLAAGDARSRIFSATVSSGAPISGCARWPAIRSSRA